MNLFNFCKVHGLDPSVLTVYETEAEQLEAVKRYGNAIRHIPNPSEEVCLAAVKQDKGAFKYFKAEWFSK